MAHGARSFTFDAATATPEDYMTQIFNFFNVDANLWSLVSSNPGEALVVENVADNTKRAAIRRSGTTQLGFIYDEGGGSLTGGSASSAATGQSADASPEVLYTLPTLDERFMLTEYPDALAGIWQNPAKSTTPFAYHLGDIIQPDRPNYPALGITGAGVLAGGPDESTSAGFWMSSSISSGSTTSRIRCGNAGTQWFTPFCLENGVGAAVNTLAGTVQGDFVFPPLRVGANQIGGSNVGGIIGLFKYLAWYAEGTVSGGTVPTRQLLSGAVDGWLAIDEGTTTTTLLIAHETGKVFT